MLYTLEKLKHGETEIVQFYINAFELWKKIRKDFDLKKDAERLRLSKELDKLQFQFESVCGGRNIGKEIMAVSAIVQFYNINTGFETEWNKPEEFRKQMAKNLYTAVQFSSCSVEVKSDVKKIAYFYGLFEV